MDINHMEPRHSEKHDGHCNTSDERLDEDQSALLPSMDAHKKVEALIIPHREDG